MKRLAIAGTVASIALWIACLSLLYAAIWSDGVTQERLGVTGVLTAIVAIFATILTAQAWDEVTQ